MNQQEWEHRCVAAQRCADARREEEAPRRPEWWRWVGLIILMVGVLGSVWNMLRFNPWQFGTLLFTGMVIAGYCFLSSWYEGSRSGRKT